MKVYVVKQWEGCECETQCNCMGYTIDSIFLDKEKADKRKKERYDAFVSIEGVIE
jgi:hypothetical protein